MARFQKTKRQIGSLRQREDMYSKNIMLNRFSKDQAQSQGNIDKFYDKIGAEWANSSNLDNTMRRRYSKQMNLPGAVRGFDRRALDMATTKQPYWKKNR